MSVRVIGCKRARRRSAVGRAVSRCAFPADSPARWVPSAASRRRPTHAPKVHTRHALDSHRLRPVAWSSRCPSRGVSDRGPPCRRPTRLSTRSARREATTAGASDNCARGGVGRSTRHPQRRPAAARATAATRTATGAWRSAAPRAGRARDARTTRGVTGGGARRPQPAAPPSRRPIGTTACRQAETAAPRGVPRPPWGQASTAASAVATPARSAVSDACACRPERPPNRAEGVGTTPAGLKRLGPRALGQWHGQQRTHRQSARRGKQGPRSTRRQVPRADLPQPVPTAPGVPPPPARHRERGSGPLPCDHLRGARHAQRIASRLPPLHVRQGRAIGVALATRTEPVRAHGGVGTGAGALPVPPCGAPRRDPPGVRMAGRGTGAPPEGSMHPAPHHCEPSSGTIAARDGVPRRGPQRPQAVPDPGFDVYQSRLTPGHNGAEPDRADPAQAEALPGAVGGTMVVEQGGKTQPLPLLQYERHSVHSLRDDGRYLVHAQSVAQSPIDLQI